MGLISTPGPICVACEIDLAPTAYPNTTCLYDMVSLTIGFVLGSVFFWIPLCFLPPAVHFIWNCATVCMVYGIYMGAGLMQPKK